MTGETKAILELFGYTFEQRGIILIKGKGQLLTYFLTGCTNQSAAGTGQAAAGDSQSDAGMATDSQSDSAIVNQLDASTAIEALSSGVV